MEVITDIGEELDIVAEAAQPESDIGWSSTRCISVWTPGRADDVDEGLTDDENAHGHDSKVKSLLHL
ncbi:hypothetical protein GCM10009690_01080 [Brevibacterium permense]|uniref:Uncharacterized protein n=1 Tax=Brevibacterium permense TaxID=234834 RepID=A0ABN1ZQN9_9MICO